MNRNYKLYVHISPNGKRYYGITKQEPYQRWKNGLGYKSYKKDSHFYNAIKKYGWDNFKHEVLFNNLTEEEAKLLEQFYIALYDTTNRDKGYNLTLGGESSNGLKHTKETKERLSKINKTYKHTKEAKIKIGKANKGKHLSEETKRKISEANKGHKHSEEAKKKMSKNQPNSRPVICITTGKIFFTVAEAGEYYNIDKTHISSCCKGKRKSCGKLPDGTKLVWRYLNYKHNKTYRVINNKEVA